MKKITTLFMAAVLALQLFTVVVSAVLVPETLKTDYVPGTDGNLISVYPQYAVDINSAEVSCGVSGNTVTMTANSRVGVSSDWGIQGFEINERFIPDLKDGYSPEFTRDTKVLFSAKVRKAADATANAKINISFASWYNIQYEGGKAQYTDTYPGEGAGFDVVSTEWTEFRAEMTVPKNSGGNTWAFLFGLASGTAAGAKVEVDMTSLYFAQEQTYDMKNQPLTPSVLEAGKDSTATFAAQIVNQNGTLGAFPQGTFSWYVMNEEKTMFAENIQITERADNTAEVSVFRDTPTGIYKIVAQSDLYPEFIKSATLVVADENFAYTIYVSPNGNDHGEGTKADPLQTPLAARNLARRYIAEDKLPLEVIFRGGDYRFDESFSLGSEDSGTEEKKVTYRAYDGETVRFKGSKKLDLSKARKVTNADMLSRLQNHVKADIYEIDLAEQGINPSQICEPAEGSTTLKLDYNREFNGFYINGKSMDISCWPNGGDEAAYTFDAENAVNRFSYIDSAPDRWGKASDWWVNIFSMYDYIPLRLKAESIDTQNRVIYTGSNGGRYETAIINPYTPTWKAYNLPEEIDLPGEYSIDPDHMKLYFLPPCDIKGATAELSVIGDPVITVEGAEHMALRNLEFSQINDDGIVMTDTEHIEVSGCTFQDIGFRGLAIIGTQKAETVQYRTGDKIPYGEAVGEVPTAKDASYHIGIRNNIFYNIGSSAIHINGGNIDTLTPSGNVVEQNFISRFSQNVYWDGIVVAGVGTVVRNNHIADAPYYAIRIYGNDHLIEYNEIYDVIKNSNDAAAIYSGASAVARGTVIQYNYLHHLKTWKETKNDWEIGIYFDDCQQGNTARYNIIADVHEGIVSNGAGNYTLEGNTVVNTQLGMRFAYNAGAVPDKTTRTATEEGIYDKQTYYEAYPDLADYINGISPKKSSSAVGNLFSGTDTMFQYANKYGTTIKLLSQEKDAAFSENQSVDKSVFVNPDGGDYRIKSVYASSYPYALSESFDMEKIGMSENITLNAQTSPFALLYPANGARGVTTEDVWLSWENAFGASKYRVTVATDSDFAHVVYEDMVPYSALHLSEVLTVEKDTTYYWKVTAVNASKDFEAQWQSGVHSFKTLGTDILDFTVSKNVVSANITAYGKNISQTEAICYIAVFDASKKLCGVEQYPLTLVPGELYSFKENCSLADTNDAACIKMFIWTKNGVPLTESAVYQTEKKTITKKDRIMMNKEKISVGILGFGGRGSSMAQAIESFPDEIYVKAIAEPVEHRRQSAIDTYGVSGENVFSDYKEFLSKGVMVDLLMITTMDNYHYEPLMKALEIGYKNILLEKPISPSMEECIKMTEAAERYGANVIILHSLRYNLYYRKIREIINSGEIGKVMGIRHVEGASLMNYSHSFVRGNWANTKDSASFIMAKSCHDTDIIPFMIGKKYKKISSFGGLTYFKKENAPEGCADRCVDCKYQDTCTYSAVPMYKAECHKPWYNSMVTKEGYKTVEEAAEKGVYGQCVYKCDNNLVDNQVMSFEFEDGATGTFTVTAFDSGRRTEVQGTLYTLLGHEGKGEILLRNQIGGEIDKVYHAFSESSTTVEHLTTDIQLVQDLIDFIRRGDATNLSFIQGALHSHLACFAAEISREEERVVYIEELLKN